MYFTGMQQNDGKGVYPFADDCNRIENGGLTTNVPVANGKQRPDPKTATGYSSNWGCKEQFDSGLLHFVTRIRDRRYVAVDPERGLVFSFIFFDRQRLEPGDGFWRTATAKGKYRLFVDDPQTGNVAMITTLTEATGPQSAQTIAIRLKIDNRQITEIETFTVRTGLSGGTGSAELEKLGSPNPLFLQTIPAAERASREELIKTANMYFSALEKNDGEGKYSFFADDWERLEDGQQTTHNPNLRTGSGFAAAAGGRGAPKQAPAPAAGFNPATLGCKEQFQSGYFRFVTRIRDRRFVAVDPERGLVFSFVFFDHAAGKYRDYKMSDGTDASNGPTRPWTWELAEMFKIEHGKIRRVEALLDQVPYGMLSGWSTWEEGMSAKPR